MRFPEKKAFEKIVLLVIQGFFRKIRLCQEDHID